HLASSLFLHATTTTALYRLSLHDALPILPLIARKLREHGVPGTRRVAVISHATRPEQRTVTGTLDDIEARAAAAKIEPPALIVRSEEHTSELQSLRHLVCRLLLEKKNKYR